MPPSTTLTLRSWMSLRTLPTATLGSDAVSSRKSSIWRPAMPPALLICSTVNCATCQLALPDGAIAPVMSVAMPILIGSAAWARRGASIQPPPPAIQPAAPSALAPIRRRRPRVGLSVRCDDRSVMSKPPLSDEPLWTQLHDDQCDDEHQRIGQHRDDEPRQAGGHAADGGGAQHRSFESADAAQHHRQERLHQETRADVGGELIERHDQRAGEAGQGGA